MNETNQIPRIAIVGSRGIPAMYGGYETIVQELSVGLAKSGFKVYVSCESKWFKSKPYGSYKGVRLVYFPLFSSIRMISEFVHDALAVLWVTPRSEIIYMVGQGSILTLAFPRILHKIVLVNVDGMESAREKFNPLVRFLLKIFDTLAGKIANHVIVDSRSMGKLIKNNLGINTIYLPYGVSEISPLDESIIDRYGVKRNEYYLVLARLIPDNNIDLIIDGFKKAHSKKKLIIVGSLSNTRYIKGLLSRKDEQILFLGGIYDQRLQRSLRYYSFAYIHGHERGGTNPSLLEALSCHNRILAIDVVFNKEVARESALYFRKDPEDLKTKIQILENPKQAKVFAEDSFLIYKSNYTAQIAVLEFVNFVMKVFKKSALSLEQKRQNW